MPDHDAIVVGAGHNGLVAATLLARAGWRVLVLERSEQAGGAAISSAPFPGLDVRLSRYAYLVSLFPRRLLEDLGVAVELRRRRVSSYTPSGASGVLIAEERAATRASLIRTLGDDRELGALERLQAKLAAVAPRVFASLTEPLRPRTEFRRVVGDDELWRALFEAPLSELLESNLESDLVRGVVATDGLIGTFAGLDDARLIQNRCFLYHVVGNGTGRWDVPVGGMGALSAGLLAAARAAGADVRCGSEVIALSSVADSVEVETTDGEGYRARHALVNAAPSVLARLTGGDRSGEPPPEGAQLKLNLLLARLPRLRDAAVEPSDAFAGTFHVGEGYEQLGRAYAEAVAGRVPELPPCETYCHSLTDPSILSDELRAAGAHTMTVFVLHMPARLFRSDHQAAKHAAVAATLRSLDAVLAEPIEDCLLRTTGGEPCLEARTPLELERELAMPGGHIFHRDLAWPFAESEEEVGRWGVETADPRVWLCGAGARRGGGVSGIPGHNAARAVLAAG